jgi:hypothetical protein
MRLEPRTIFIGLIIAGIAGAALFLPAISFVGNMLSPSQPAPASSHVPPLLADAIWARANGGRAAQLEPLNPFTLGRMASCHVLAERLEPALRDAEHDECMKLMPAVEAIGYLSTVHMKSEGVWQDPRVPFVQIAMMTRISAKWSKAQLLDTLAARGEFGAGFVGAESASTGYFGRPAETLTLPQAALIGAMAGDRRVDPWCDPVAAAALRRQVLERMRDNGAIDETAARSANATELGLTPPPPGHKPCND